MVKVAEAWVPVDDTTGANGVGNGTAGPVHGGGLVSETTMAFATIVWGAMPLPVGHARDCGLEKRPCQWDQRAGWQRWCRRG